MSVAEIGQLHNRYVRLADRFKTAWTYHQFASGVFKNLLGVPLPYEIDFQEIYEPIRQVAEMIRAVDATPAVAMMDRSEQGLDVVIESLTDADESVGPSVMRRFFEKVRQQDEKILFYLIKFYLYADAVDGERRDKLDFLFTKIAEEFIEERGEYASKDSLELRNKFQSLLAVRPKDLGSQEDAVALIRRVRDLKDGIESSETFEALTASGLLDEVRKLKHGIGDQLFHPDVLLAIVQCNVATKNEFARHYSSEEEKILEDSSRLLENEEAIARGFGGENPELLDEMARFKEFKREFDESRARSNVKYNVIARLKSSMSNILSQLDRELDEESLEEGGLALQEARVDDLVRQWFGEDPLLHDHLVRIVGTLDETVPNAAIEVISRTPAVAELRLEPWEIEAFRSLYRSDNPLDADMEVHLLYLRAAALRLRVDEEARELVELAQSGDSDARMLERTHDTLERAKEFDATFKEALHEGFDQPRSASLHGLYRSRLRLLRGFSGLWLIYDQLTA